MLINFFSTVIPDLVYLMLQISGALPSYCNFPRQIFGIRNWEFSENTYFFWCFRSGCGLEMPSKHTSTNTSCKKIKTVNKLHLLVKIAQTNEPLYQLSVNTKLSNKSTHC